MGWLSHLKLLVVMKVLVVGDWLADIYEQAIYDGFSRLGCVVDRFSWIQYFKYYQYPGHFQAKRNLLFSLYYRIQNRFTAGPVLNKINKDLINFSKKGEYDLVFIYRGTHVFPSTIKKLKSSGCKVFGYNNDDPFSLRYPKYFWRHYLKGTKYYDHIYCYREKNMEDYKKINYKNTSILRSYYVKNKNFPINPNEIEQKFNSDIIFVGHYEDDGRDEIVLKLLETKLKVKLYGTGWEHSKLIENIEVLNGPVKPIYENYNRVLCGAKVALVFFSKKNNDTYTRRVFEIAAAKTAMLCERTLDMQSMFLEHKEIEYFSTSEQCVEKAINMIRQKTYLEIAEQAYTRLLEDGHEVKDRAAQVLRDFENVRINKK